MSLKVNGKPVQHSVEPEDFPGKLYPEWQLKDEADNLPESAEQAGFEKWKDNELEN